jgi:hypothetical protein
MHRAGAKGEAVYVRLNAEDGIGEWLALTKYSRITGRVKDDAFELIVAVKIVEPLLSNEPKTDVPKFLRRILSRYAVLGVTRLMAPIGTGRTGTTASLKSLLQLAGSENILPAEFIEDMNARVSNLETEFEHEGFTLQDLTHLRHTQIAHTLIPHQDANQVWMHAIVEAADKLFEIATEIEKALVDAGCPPMVDNTSAPKEWEAKSLEFWTRLNRGILPTTGS